MPVQVVGSLIQPLLTIVLGRYATMASFQVRHVDVQSCALRLLLCFSADLPPNITHSVANHSDHNLILALLVVSISKSPSLSTKS